MIHPLALLIWYKELSIFKFVTEHGFGLNL